MKGFSNDMHFSTPLSPFNFPHFFLNKIQDSDSLLWSSYNFFQTMVLLIAVDASSLLFAVVFLKLRSNINMLQVMRRTIMNLMEEIRFQNRYILHIAKLADVDNIFFPGLPLPVERVWSMLGFPAGPNHNLIFTHHMSYANIMIS